MRSIATEKIVVTLRKGFIGLKEGHRRTLRSLGLRRIGQSRILPNVNPILGQVNKVIQWIDVAPYEEK